MKKWIAGLLALCLTALCLMPSALAAEKNEIVYVNLHSGGELDAVYIVNRFEASSAESIVDYGSYYKVANLSDITPLEQNSDSMRLTVPEGTLFYQGDPVSASLPWSIRVNYLLDGVPIRAEELSGQSGALEMQITIGKGSEGLTDFYEHYALNMTVTLDGERCSGIVAESATIANSGTDRLLTYVVLPSPDVSYTITADVTDFAMADISINGVPLGMDVDIDTSEIDDKVSELQDGVSQLSSGSSQLASGAYSLKGGAKELQGGTTTLAEGTESLVSGAAQFSAGLDEARAGSAQIAAASAQIVTAVNDLDGKIQGAPQMSIGEMWALCNALLDAVTQQERALTDLRGKIGTLVSLAESLEDKAQEICSLIPDAGFPESDISLLRTLLNRGSGNSDVSSVLSSEIAALRRILNKAGGDQRLPGRAAQVRGGKPQAGRLPVRAAHQAGRSDRGRAHGAGIGEGRAAIRTDPAGCDGRKRRQLRRRRADLAVRHDPRNGCGHPGAGQWHRRIADELCSAQRGHLQCGRGRGFPRHRRRHAAERRELPLLRREQPQGRRERTQRGHQRHGRTGAGGRGRRNFLHHRRRL